LAHHLCTTPHPLTTTSSSFRVILWTLTHDHIRHRFILNNHIMHSTQCTHSMVCSSRTCNPNYRISLSRKDCTRPHSSRICKLSKHSRQCMLNMLYRHNRLCKPSKHYRLNSHRTSGVSKWILEGIYLIIYFLDETRCNEIEIYISKK